MIVIAGGKYCVLYDKKHLFPSAFQNLLDFKKTLISCFQLS